MKMEVEGEKPLLFFNPFNTKKEGKFLASFALCDLLTRSRKALPSAGRHQRRRARTQSRALCVGLGSLDRLRRREGSKSTQSQAQSGRRVSLQQQHGHRAQRHHRGDKEAQRLCCTHAARVHVVPLCLSVRRAKRKRDLMRCLLM